MRLKLRRFLWSLLKRTEDRPPDQSRTIRKLSDALVALATREDAGKTAYADRLTELVESRQMAGSGPWLTAPAAARQTDRIVTEALQRFGKPIAARESIIPGAYPAVSADLELALSSLEWRREVSFSSLEFSRDGIQQLMLICRLYYIKHPWIRRGITLSAAYVFGQGVELSSPDEAANEVLQRFRARNAVSLGQCALTEQEKRKSYDGNIFWVLFGDTQDRGETNVRVIDATEITEIVTDPNDVDSPQFYKRIWTSRQFDPVAGQWRNETKTRWYPALNYEPAEKPPKIAGVEVAWDSPVYHRRVGHVASWTFGCPRAYPAIDYARGGKKHLDACANVTQALSRIALDITTKGGQQAVSGIQAQIQRGPSSDIHDLIDPTTSGAASFVHGPGTKIEAFKSRGAGADPADIKEYRNMVACCLEIPPTWLGDMETSNLSTAQTLDRPTELGFLLKQEEWQEDLVTMGLYALRVSKTAPSGRLREAYGARVVTFREAARITKNGHWRYEAVRQPQDGAVEVLCNFPAIREGDIPSLIKATADAMVIDRNGAAHGIDEKVAARKFYELLDVKDGDQRVEEQYPKKTYDPDRTKDPEPPVVPPLPGTKPPVKEAVRIRAAVVRVEKALALSENGSGQ